MVAVERRHRREVHAELQAARQRERPDAAPVRITRRTGAAPGECPAGHPLSGWSGWSGGPGVRLRARSSARRAVVMVRFISGRERHQGSGQACGRAGESAGPYAAMADRDAVGVGDGDAEGGVRAEGGGGGEGAAQGRVEGAEAVSLAGPLGQAEEGGEREHQVRQRRRGPAGRPQERRSRCGRGRSPVAAGAWSGVVAGAAGGGRLTAASRAAGAWTAGAVVTRFAAARFAVVGSPVVRARRRRVRRRPGSGCRRAARTGRRTRRRGNRTRPGGPGRRRPRRRPGPRWRRRRRASSSSASSSSASLPRASPRARRRRGRRPFGRRRG